MSQIVLDVSSETLLALKLPLEEAGETLLLAAAVKFFELGRLSSGRCKRADRTGFAMAPHVPVRWSLRKDA